MSTKTGAFWLPGAVQWYGRESRLAFIKRLGSTKFDGERGCFMERAQQFRQHFPSLNENVHLCSCSEGALSDRVMEAMDDFMDSWRTKGAPWDVWMDEVEQARKAYAKVIHANPEDVAIVSCASGGAFQVVSASNSPIRGLIL